MKIWPWVKPYWRYAAGAMIGTVVSVSINLLIPLRTATVIDDGIAANNSVIVRDVALSMVGLILMGMVVSAFTSIMAVRLSFNAITDLRRDLYGQAQSFSFGNLDRLSSGAVLTRLTSDITKVTTVVTMGLTFMTQVPLLFVGALVAIVILDASLSVIVLFMVPVIGAVVWYTLTRSGLLYDAVQTRLDRLNTVLAENIQGTEVIKAFVRQDYETERFDVVADDLADQSIVVNQLVASLMPTLIAVSSFGVAAVLWLGGSNVIDGSLSEGDLVAFISYLALVAMPMMMFAFIQPLVAAAGASMARISQVLEEEPEVVDPIDGKDLGASDQPGDIRFESVSFCYGPPISESGSESSSESNGESNGDSKSSDPSIGRGEALSEVSIHIPQGRTVAILGATGSGKSTLVNLIPRFYDATSGVVKVGGIDVRELTKSSLRRRIGIALQEPELFTGTVMENLRFGRPEATEEEIKAASIAAQADEFISAMTDGYESQIEQGGSNLSGGQRQRMAIARTLIVDPDILILDDSTSAVDLETEARIQEALATYEDRTVVLVAQRISTALGADVIIVLDRGRVCANGTHDELMTSSDIYQEIFRSQLGEAVA